MTAGLRGDSSDTWGHAHTKLTHARAHTCAYKHAYKYAHTHACTHKHIHTHTRTHTHKRTHARTHSRKRTHARTHALRYTTPVSPTSRAWCTASATSPQTRARPWALPSAAQPALGCACCAPSSDAQVGVGPVLVATHPCSLPSPEPVGVVLLAACAVSFSHSGGCLRCGELWVSAAACPKNPQVLWLTQTQHSNPSLLPCNPPPKSAVLGAFHAAPPHTPPRPADRLALHPCCPRPLQDHGRI